MVEAYCLRVKVDCISDVVPFASSEVHCPLAVSCNHPVEGVVGGARLAVKQAILHFGEGALEEAHLVFFVWRRRAGGSMLHGEVVEHLSGVDGGRGLRDQLSPEHAIVIPDGAIVDGNLNTLLRARVGRVLVVRGQVHVFSDRTTAMNVVLVLANLVGEGPVIQKGAGSLVVEATIPQDRSRSSTSQGSGEKSE